MSESQTNKNEISPSFQSFFNSLNGGNSSVYIKTNDGTPIEVTAEVKPNGTPVLKAKKKGNK